MSAGLRSCGLQINKIQSSILLFIKQLSPWIELTLVVLISFGESIYVSLETVFEAVDSGALNKWSYTLNDTDSLETTQSQVIVLLVLSLFLYIRDWRLKDFNLEISMRLAGVGFLLLLAKNILIISAYTVFSYFQVVSPGIENLVNYTVSMSLYGLIPLVIVNSIFEEVIVVGYIFKRLENMNPAVIVIISTLLRQSYHLYQGPTTFFTLIPTGLVFSIYYWKYRRLGPVIVAHGLTNLFICL